MRWIFCLSLTVLLQAGVPAAGQDASVRAAKADALIKQGSNLTPQTAGAAAAAELDLIDQCVQADDYDTAVRLLSAVQSAVALADPLDNAVANHFDSAREVMGEYDSALPAIDSLAQNPDDPAKNLQAGRFICFFKGDWKLGLPMLAKSSDVELKELAQTDLANPPDPSQQISLANDWWDYADQAAPLIRAHCQARAAAWYRRAISRLPSGQTGLAQQRIVQVPQPLVDSMLPPPRSFVAARMPSAPTAVVAAPAALPSAPGDPATIVTAGKKATVLIEIQAGPMHGSGSAFCIDAAFGLFITNHHVAAAGGMKDTKLILVLNAGQSDQRTFPATVLKTDPNRDLAIIKVEAATGLTALALGDANALVETASLTAFGYPFGDALSLSKGQYPAVSVNVGRVTSLRRSGSDIHLIQLDAAVNPGNSGGPVLDGGGKVVGIIVAGIPGSGVNFAIPVNQLTDMLRRSGITMTAGILPPTPPVAVLTEPLLPQPEPLPGLPGQPPSDGKDFKVDQLVGRWSVARPNYHSVWTFRPDGTVSGSKNGVDGTWRQVAGNIFIEWENGRRNTLNLPIDASRTVGESDQGEIVAVKIK